MGDRSGIEWTDASWNPVTGCTEVSPGCDHCYAAREARGRLRARYLEQETVEPERADDPFAVRLWPDRLDQPLRWRRARRIFVNSMSDLFHKAIPREYVERIFTIMGLAQQHTFQVLTKRPARAAEFLRVFYATDVINDYAAQYMDYEDMPDVTFPLANVWIGTSVERQDEDYRIRHLLDVPASVRFLSCEPLIGPLRLPLHSHEGNGICPHCSSEHCYYARGDDFLRCGSTDDVVISSHDLHWVIVGGESGPGARPMDVEWARSIVRQCKAAGVPVFVKQLGRAWALDGMRDIKGASPSEWPEDLRVREWPEVFGG